MAECRTSNPEIVGSNSTGCGFSFFCKFWRTSALSVGLMVPLFWTTGHVCSGFQNQGGSSHLHTSSPACNRILRFTSGVTPADLLLASMAVQPFSSMYLQTSICWAHKGVCRACNCLIVEVEIFRKPLIPILHNTVDFFAKNSILFLRLKYQDQSVGVIDIIINFQWKIVPRRIEFIWEMKSIG